MHIAHKIIFMLFVMALIIICACVAVLLVMLNPLFNPGPLLFRQGRVGQFENPIQIWKFRTMSGPDAAGFAPEQTARTPMLGRLIRYFHLDELPQVWNILRGEMVLIGPRPEQLALYPRMAQRIPCYRMRVLWKPGLMTHARLDYGYASTAAQHHHRALAEIAEMQQQSRWGEILLLARVGRYVIGRLIPTTTRRDVPAVLRSLKLGA